MNGQPFLIHIQIRYSVISQITKNPWILFQSQIEHDKIELTVKWDGWIKKFHEIRGKKESHESQPH